MSRPTNTSTRLRLAVIPLGCWLAGCARAPDSLPMPAQYTMPAGPEPPAAALPYARPLLTMSDADIDGHILRDVLRADAGEPSRWTNAHPAFRLNLEDVEGLEFYLHFFLADQTFKATGAVRLTVNINGATVATPEFRSPGDHEFQCAIPADLLKRKEPTTVSIVVNPPYKSPHDGTVLGVLLFSVGFRKPNV